MKIINAFANGDRKTLKPLLTKELYKNFEDVIKERETKKLLLRCRLLELKRLKF